MNVKCLTLFAVLTAMSAAANSGTSLEQKSGSVEGKIKDCPAYLDHNFKKLHSKETINLCSLYEQKPLLIVNTASHCGFTPQFIALEALHQKYKAQGFQVVGFASDSFKQAAKSEKEAASVCFKNYGVSFTMLAPTDVKGKSANPLFKALAEKSSEPKWNFNKYLISADGEKVQWFNSRTAPDAPELIAKIDTELSQIKDQP